MDPFVKGKDNSMFISLYKSHNHFNHYHNHHYHHHCNNYKKNYNNCKIKMCRSTRV